jgi:hypothetical protein
LRWTVVAVVAALLAIVSTVAVLSIEREPAVAPAAAPEAEQIGRARDLIASQRAMWRRDGALSTIVLRAEDANLLLAYGLRPLGIGAARLTPGEGRADLQASIPLPRNPFGGWLNVSATLEQANGLPEVHGVRVGRVRIPDAVTRVAVRAALAWLLADADRRAALEALQNVLFTPRHVLLVYVWRKDLPQRLRGALRSPAEVQRLRPYHEHLARLVRQAKGFELSLATLLPPLCATATERSPGSSEADEFRALSVVLAAYVAGYRLERAIPDVAAWGRLPPRVVTLAARDDLAKHFMVSAAIAANADTALADAVGLFKEMDDARHGSGFSFDDLAADRAGTRIGERGTGPEGRAMLVRCAAGLDERDILPPVADLPHSLPEAEFLRRFGGVGTPAYQRVVDDIEARVAKLTLLR